MLIINDSTPKSDSHYELCNKHRDRELISKNAYLFDDTSIVGLLYKDCYYVISCNLVKIYFVHMCNVFLFISI